MHAVAGIEILNIIDAFDKEKQMDPRYVALQSDSKI